MDTEIFKVMMIFKDGTQSPIAEVKDMLVTACLSDPHVQNIVRGLLKITKQTQGLLLIWGRDHLTSTSIIDDTKITKQIEDVINGKSASEASS